MRKKPELVVLALDGAVPSYVREMAGKGKLPAFQRLMERGVFFTDCRPPFPTITPTCWSSFATGSTPATHGATCQDIHVNGKYPPEYISAYHSGNIQAQTFWEAAAKTGKKSLVIQLPTSGPARSANVLQVAGAGCAAVNMALPDRPTAFVKSPVPARLFTTEEEKDLEWMEKSPASGQWQPREKQENTSLLDKGGLESVVALRVEPREPLEPFHWYVKMEKGRVTVYADMEKPGEGFPVREGEWSGLMERFIPGKGGGMPLRFKAKLFHSDPDSGHLKIFFNEAGDAGPLITPEDFREQVLSIREVFPSHGHHAFLGRGLDVDTFIEAEAMAFDWQIRVFQKAMEHHCIDIAVIYSVYLDSVNHRYRSLLEGVEKGSPEQLAEAREIYGKAYALADTFLGRILDLVPEETTVAVLSDHGSVGYDTTLDPWKALEAEGLLFFRDGKVEWEKTRAYPSSTCHVYVNLKGRDTLGIVEEKDCKETVGMVIRALQKQFGEKLAFALRNEEAGLVGQGGERSGDVVYGISGSRAGGIIGGVHAMQIPTARTETGDIRSLLVLSGPRFKKDIFLDRCVHLYDIAPTLCHALGYPQPDQAEGAVAYQAFLPA